MESNFTLIMWQERILCNLKISHDLIVTRLLMHLKCWVQGKCYTMQWGMQHIPPFSTTTNNFFALSCCKFVIVLNFVDGL